MKLKKLLPLGFGIFLLFYLFKKIGFHDIWQPIEMIGWKVPLIFIPFFFINLVDTIAWIYAFKPPFSQYSLSWIQIYWLRICGEATNNFTPTAQVGGEVVRLVYLKKLGLSTTASALSIAMDKIILIISEILFIFTGFVFFILYQPSTHWMNLFISVSLILGLSLIVLLMWMLHKRILSRISHQISKRITFNYMQKLHVKITQLDDQLSEFISLHKKEFFYSNVWHYAGWVLGTFETWLILYLMGIPVTLPQALIIESLFGLIKGIGFFVVGSLGISEGGSMLLFQIFGLGTAHGLVYALLKRTREIFFAIIGWIVFLCMKHEA